jgi:hypothetical protein
VKFQQKALVEREYRVEADKPFLDHERGVASELQTRPAQEHVVHASEDRPHGVLCSMQPLPGLLLRHPVEISLDHRNDGLEVVPLEQA